MQNKNFLLAAALLVTAWLHAQQGTTSAGGNATGSGGKVTYTVGQVVYQTRTGTTGKISEGIQQPYEIFTVTGLGEQTPLIQLSVFPNPTQNTLVLRAETGTASSLRYLLTDVNGKTISTQNIFENTTAIDLSTAAAGTYFLSVLEKNQTVKSFKIIKN